MQGDTNLPRRSFLIGSAGTVVAGALSARAVAQEKPAAAAPSAAPAAAAEAGNAAKPLPPYVAWKKADALIVHSSNTIETKRSAFGTSVITPMDELFIRNNVAPPPETTAGDVDAWEVAIEGVAKSRAMTLKELKTFGVETVATILQCSGNGRSYFKHKAKGTPWTVGAAGCVVWTGVPLREITKELGGVLPGRQYITGTGGEPIPAGLDPKSMMVERSVPVEALDTALLAWEANGKPIPHAHGGPVRLIVPGYFGVNNVKYIKTLSFTEKESDAKIQSGSYRYAAVGEKILVSQTPVWKMPVKSWVTQPLQDAQSGRVQIHGVAFGGAKAVSKVEVSTDGGKSWNDAHFIGPDLGPFAWRTFAFSADLKPGTYLITSRATDADGAVQPEDTEDNDHGYGFNGWKAQAVDVTVA